MSLVKTYLLLYNLGCCAGWAYLGFVTFQAMQHGLDAVWDETSMVLKVVQTAAVMEIVHAATGMVRSSVGSVFMQVFSRVFCVWLVFAPSRASQVHWGLLLAVASWIAVEVPRYLFYAFQLFDAVPGVLKWYRYSAFYVLYPTGITGELVSMLVATVDLWNTGAYSVHMPNQYNLELSLWIVIAIVGLGYISGAPAMFGHMVKQRAKQYGKAKTN